MTTTEPTSVPAVPEDDPALKAVLAKLNDGTMALPDILKALVQVGTPQVPAVTPPVPPPPAMTKDQQEAVDRIRSVFGQVAPQERRLLKPAEVTALVEEKVTLDTLKKMAEGRLEDMRATVFHHLDLEAETHITHTEDIPRDSRGFYAIKGQVKGTPGTGRMLTREVREEAPQMDAEALKALADNPLYEDFTHDDYLAMTTATRVVDEDKFRLHLKAKPTIARVVTQAVKSGKIIAALYLRSEK
jgi:hypothetical protein